MIMVKIQFHAHISHLRCCNSAGKNIPVFSGKRSENVKKKKRKDKKLDLIPNPEGCSSTLNVKTTSVPSWGQKCQRRAHLTLLSGEAGILQSGRLRRAGFRSGSEGEGAGAASRGAAASAPWRGLWDPRGGQKHLISSLPLHFTHCCSHRTWCTKASIIHRKLSQFSLTLSANVR